MFSLGHWLSCVLTRVCSRRLSLVRVGPLCHSPSSRLIQTSNENCSMDLGMTHDDKTIVCFHLARDIDFDLSKPIPRPDPLLDPTETHDLVLKSKATNEILKDECNPNIEKLSQMFYTTKHCWYPVGEYHLRRRNRNPPKVR